MYGFFAIPPNKTNFFIKKKGLNAFISPFFRNFAADYACQQRVISISRLSYVTDYQHIRGKNDCYKTVTVK